MTKATTVDIRLYLKRIEGMSAWRARLGHGSFLTFDFGRRIKRNGHFDGEWRLWVYQSNWRLQHGETDLASSESKRHTIEIAVARFENRQLLSVSFETRNSITEFVFSDSFRLAVSPADYLDDPDERDVYWMLFMPQNEVLSVGPGGVDVHASDK